MAYEFKKLSDVEVVETPADTANVLIEEGGIIKKAPKTAVGGANTEWDAVIEWYFTDDDDHLTLLSGEYNTVYNKIINGEIPNIVIKTCTQYGDFAYSVERPIQVNLQVDSSDSSVHSIRISQPSTVMTTSDGMYWTWNQDNTLTN